MAFFLLAFFVDKGLQDDGGGNGIEEFFLFLSRKFGGGKFIFGGESAEAFIFKVNWDVDMFF